jgi:hypothetical protein
MFSLRYRDLLPPATLDELESLVTRLRTFLLQEHNEDGTHFVNEWTDYQPEILSHTLGNGRLRGRYLKQGRIVFYHVYFECGSTTTLTSSPIDITLPTPQQATTTTSWLVGAEFLGTAKGFVDGGDYTGIAVLGAGVVSPMSDAGFWNSAIPAAWGDGSTLVMSGWYECDPDAVPSVRFHG